MRYLLWKKYSIYFLLLLHREVFSSIQSNTEIYSIIGIYTHYMLSRTEALIRQQEVEIVLRDRLSRVCFPGDQRYFPLFHCNNCGTSQGFRLYFNNLYFNSCCLCSPHLILPKKVTWQDLNEMYHKLSTNQLIRSIPASFY